MIKKVRGEIWLDFNLIWIIKKFRDIWRKIHSWQKYFCYPISSGLKKDFFNNNFLSHNWSNLIQCAIFASPKYLSWPAKIYFFLSKVPTSRSSNMHFEKWLLLYCILLIKYFSKFLSLGSKESTGKFPATHSNASF